MGVVAVGIEREAVGIEREEASRGCRKVVDGSQGGRRKGPSWRVAGPSLDAESGREVDSGERMRSILGSSRRWRRVVHPGGVGKGPWGGQLGSYSVRTVV